MTVPGMRDPLAVLGLGPDATADQIRHTYRLRAQLLHPDRYVDAAPEVRAEAARAMQELAAAYAAVREQHSAPARPAAPPERPGPAVTDRRVPRPARRPGSAWLERAFAHYDQYGRWGRRASDGRRGLKAPPRS